MKRKPAKAIGSLILIVIISALLFAARRQSQLAIPEQKSKYPNTADGLRIFLDDILMAGKSGDRAKIAELVSQTEIPNYHDWFYRMYSRDKAESWITPYGEELQQNEEEFRQMFLALAQSEGRITTRKLVDSPSSDKGLEWALLHSAREPLDIYFAEWESAKHASVPNQRIGYFIFIDGMFRWDSLIHSVTPTIVKPKGRTRKGT